jgi:hypothetical protein
MLLSKTEANRKCHATWLGWGNIWEGTTETLGWLSFNGQEMKRCIPSNGRPTLYFGGRDINNGRLYEKQLQLEISQQASYVQMTRRIPGAILGFSVSQAAQGNHCQRCYYKDHVEQCVRILLASWLKVRDGWGGWGHWHSLVIFFNLFINPVNSEQIPYWESHFWEKIIFILDRHQFFIDHFYFLSSSSECLLIGCQVPWLSPSHLITLL